MIEIRKEAVVNETWNDAWAKWESAYQALVDTAGADSDAEDRALGAWRDARSTWFDNVLTLPEDPRRDLIQQWSAEVQRRWRDKPAEHREILLELFRFDIPAHINKALRLQRQLASWRAALVDDFFQSPQRRTASLDPDESPASIRRYIDALLDRCGGAAVQRPLRLEKHKSGARLRADRVRRRVILMRCLDVWSKNGFSTIEQVIESMRQPAPKPAYGRLLSRAELQLTTTLAPLGEVEPVLFARLLTLWSPKPGRKKGNAIAGENAKWSVLAKVIEKVWGYKVSTKQLQADRTSDRAFGASLPK